MFDEVLKAANCTSVACLRDSSQETLFKANAFLITNVTDGSSGAFGPGTGFTPVVDGAYVKDLVPTLLARGSYNKGIKQVVVGNTANEGMNMSPADDMPNAFPALVRETIPNADNATVRCIQSLYKYPAELPQKLAWDWATDMSFACNAYFTAKAYNEKVRRYVMAIPPATHGLDLNCTSTFIPCLLDKILIICSNRLLFHRQCHHSRSRNFARKGISRVCSTLYHRGRKHEGLPRPCTLAEVWCRSFLF